MKKLSLFLTSILLVLIGSLTLVEANSSQEPNFVIISDENVEPLEEGQSEEIDVITSEKDEVELSEENAKFTTDNEGESLPTESKN